MTIVSVIACNSGDKDTEKKMNYPTTEQRDSSEVYFGTELKDPYRWLEDDNSPETADWVKRQNAFTDSVLAAIPYRDKIKKRLNEVWNYAKMGTPYKRGEHYFYFKNDGLQNQDILYVVDEPGGEEKIFFDPNKLSDDGTVALSTTSFSDDGNYFAYQISRGGSDWKEIYVRNVETGEDMEDHIEWVKFSGISWYNDGFFYCRYDEPKKGDELSQKNEFHKVFYHKLGTKQAIDRLVFEDTKNPQRNHYVDVVGEGKYLTIYKSESTYGSAVSIKDLADKNSKFIDIVNNFDNEHSILDFIDGKFIVLTNYNAPKYRVMTFTAEKPEIADWQELIPESKGVLQSVNFANGKLIANYITDVHSVLKVYDLKGTFLNEISLPGIGTVSSFQSKKKENTAFFNFSSYTVPTSIYKYDVSANKSELYFRPDVQFDSDAYETKQIFYASKDGTKIPMELVYKKGIKLNGENPVLIYGYGGFNISLNPRFSTATIPWLENGGIYVNTHLRGGGEYGEEWHKAGTKMQKQNVFDDFIAAAEYLIENKYTNPEKIMIRGGSNGGLLIGAVLNQRPDLYQVAFPAVGVMDMLRYHKFTIGWAWAGDYGRSDDSKEMFDYLHAYSPIHSMQAVDYPAVMVTTADHDDRVVPAHSFKYIATLQEKTTGSAPCIIRIATKAGHGAGKSTEMIIDEYTDIWAFAFYNLGMKPQD